MTSFSETATSRLVRIQLLGPRQSGKSALLFRYCDDAWVENPNCETIGADFKIRNVTVDRTAVKVKVTDVPNRVSFCDNVPTDSWLPDALEHCDAAMVVFDASDHESSLLQAREWLTAIQNSDRKIVIALIANKLDLVPLRSVYNVTDSAAELVTEFENSLQFGTSAKSCLGVNNAFERVIRACLEANESPRVSQFSEWSGFTPERVRQQMQDRQADTEMAESDAQTCLTMIRERVLSDWAEKIWKIDLSPILGKDGEPNTQRRRLARARLNTLCFGQGLTLSPPKFGDAGLHSVWIAYAEHQRSTVAMEVETQRLRQQVVRVAMDSNVDCVSNIISLKHPYCLEFETAEKVAAIVRHELVTDKKFDPATILQPTEIGSEESWFKFRLVLPPIQK